jgi:hypothetical protein
MKRRMQKQIWNHLTPSQQIDQVLVKPDYSKFTPFSFHEHVLVMESDSDMAYAQMVEHADVRPESYFQLFAKDFDSFESLFQDTKLTKEEQVTITEFISQMKGTLLAVCPMKDALYLIDIE